MVNIHHLNCGTLVVPSFPTVVCHCLAIVEGQEAVLIDTGIGLLDAKDPVGRLGQDLIDAAGFRFNESDTAAARLDAIGIERDQVRNIVLTHADPDHTGGLGDFPESRVHISTEELDQINAEHPRYARPLFSHGPHWNPVGPSETREDWFGLAARRVDAPVSTDILLVPLPGHTLGHCGVAVRRGEHWVLHVGDAYYMRGELSDPDHPAGQLAAIRAEDDAQRRESLDQIRRIARDHADEVTMFGYHDISELPSECIDWE